MRLPKIFGGRAETKESATGSILVMNPQQAQWTPRDYKSFAQEGYSRNVVAYRSINRVAEAVASVEWEVWRDDKQLTESPLLDLLARPNPMQSGSEFITAKIGYLMISGNSYEEAVDVGGESKELYTHRPDRMTVLPSSNGFPRGYVYKVGQREVIWEVDTGTFESPIRHMKLFNPLNDWYGMSPIEAGSYGIDQHNESMSWIQSMLQNSARPSGALSTKDDNVLTPEQFNRLKTQIEDQYTGAKNAGRPMLLEGGLTWQQMGLSPDDMSIIETKYSAARDVSLAFGVPPQLLGIPGDNTYSNYSEARLSFWEDTVIPLVTRVAEDWTNWHGPKFGDLTVKPNMDKIPAIADKRSKIWSMADTSTDLTINERRGLKGFEPLDGGDTILVGAGQISLADASAPLDLNMTDNKALAIVAGYEKAT